MTYRCKQCNEQWSGASAWMMLYVCPKCGSTDTEEAQYLPIGIEVKIVEKGTPLDEWYQQIKKYIKKSN